MYDCCAWNDRSNVRYTFGTQANYRFDDDGRGGGGDDDDKVGGG